MANLIVTNLNDSGAGSLREKIQVANASLGVADTIRFADNLQGTITLTSGQLTLSDDITINGNTMGGAKSEITISGNNASRIFDVVGAGVDVALNSLTLTNGGTSTLAGGAIKVGAGGTQTLAINDTTIMNSTAGRGGALFASVGTQVSLTNALILGNTATSYGGGIYVKDGSLAMTNTTVTNNSANGDGGGIDINGNVVVNILNSTITGNRANADGAGTAFTGGGLDIFTPAANVILTNTVVADNFAGVGTTESDVFGTVDTANNSVFGTAAAITAGTANQLNIADVGLGPLALHGGSTATLNIISPTSVLINAGVNAAVTTTTDANGAPRIDSGRVDVGATEYVEANIVVTTLSDVVNAGDGVISLREAITLANTNAAPSHIVFQAGMNGSIALATGLILTNNVSINGDTNGDGDSNITLTDTATGLNAALISINANVTTELTSLTFSGIDSFGAASAISNKGSLTLSYSVLSGNSSTGNASYQIGGNGQNAATVFNSGSMVVNQTLFANNTAVGGVGNRGYNFSSGVNGGNASASILNLGGASLTLSGLALIGGTATGGAGERGSVALFDPGHPFIGFNGGNGGSAALGVLNSGTMSGTYGQGTIGSATGGVGGLGGAGTSGGLSGVNGVAGAGDTNNLNLGGVGAPTTANIGTELANNLVGVFDHRTVFGLGGADNITGTGKCYLFGGSGNDFLTSQTDSRVYGGLGNDMLINSALGGLSGLWDGGAGIDTFNASTGGAVFGLYIDLSTGQTNVSGTVRNIENIIGTNNAGLNDRLTGDAGANAFQGMAGTNTIFGGGGDDYIYGGVGADIIDGGADVDTVDYSTSAGVTINLLTHTQSGGDAANDTLTRIENIVGSNLSGDFLTGDDNANLLMGLGGDDTFKGGLGSDTYIGGGGTDTADYSDKTLAVQVVLNGNNIAAVTVGGIIEDNMSNVENIIGGSGADVLTGDLLANRFQGGLGADKLNGGDGFNFSSVQGSVYRLYEAALAREPDAGGLLNWVNAINGGTSLVAAAAGFVGSAEFTAKYGALNNTQFVTQLYANVLHRAPDAGGLANWVNALNAGSSRASVLTGFSESLEFKNNTALDTSGYMTNVFETSHLGDVYRLYGASLGRAPDAGGFVAQLNAVASGLSLNSLAANFLNSTEFQITYGSLSNTAFVTKLYNNVLHRAPEAAGLANWVNYLNSGATRVDVLLGFSQSAEYVLNTDTSLHGFIDTNMSSLWSDRLVGGAGNDDLFGGLGSDTFAFNKTGLGSDHIHGLDVFDHIEFTGFGYSTATQVLSHMSQVATDVVFTDQGETITFHNTQLAILKTQGVFVFA
jgi:predicted outer membrane repeat protein